MKTNKYVSSADIAESIFMDYRSDPVILKKRSQGISSMTADRHNRGLEITEVFIDENIVESFKSNTKKFNKSVKDYNKYLKDMREINR